MTTVIGVVLGSNQDTSLCHSMSHHVTSSEEPWHPKDSGWRRFKPIIFSTNPDRMTTVNWKQTHHKLAQPDSLQWQVTMGVLQTGPKHFPKCKVGCDPLTSVYDKQRHVVTLIKDGRLWRLPDFKGVAPRAFRQCSCASYAAMRWPRPKDWGRSQEFANSSEKCRQRCL